MKLTTKQLLKRRSLTGEQVGKALIDNLVHNYRLMSQGKPAEQIITGEHLRTLVSKLKTEEDQNVYNVYGAINDSIISIDSRKLIFEQQFYNGFYRLYLNLARIADAERAEFIFNLSPFAVTQTEYDHVKGLVKDTLRNVRVNYSELVLGMVEYYRDNPEKACKMTKKALNKAKREMIKNEALLARYNKERGFGYYILPDGSRNDQLSEEEFNNRANAYFMEYYRRLLGEDVTSEKAYAYHLDAGKRRATELFFKGPEAIREAGQQRGVDLSELSDQTLLDAITKAGNREGERETRNKMYEIIYPEGSNFAKWHYKQIPTHLLKHRVLETFLNYYRGIGNPEADPKDFFKQFTNDFQELYQAVRSEIELAVPQARRVKSSQANKHIATQGELADLGLQRYIDLATPKENNIINGFSLIHPRREIDSLAIINDPPPYNIDERGFYKSILPDPLIGLLTLYSLSDNQTIKEGLHATVTNTIIPAIRQLLAHNTLIDILARVYNLEDTEPLKIDLSTTLEPKIKQYNEVLYHIYQHAFGRSKEVKRKILKETFTPLYLEDYYPSELNQDYLKYRLRQAGFTPKAQAILKNFDDLLNELLGIGG